MMKASIARKASTPITIRATITGGAYRAPCPPHAEARARVSATRSVPVTRREVLFAALGGVLLAIVMTWPLVFHLGGVVPRDIGDPLAEAWQPAWGGHALIHQPLHFFDSNRFWPIKDSLAFGDALIGYAPAGIFSSGVKDAIV